MEEEGGTEAVTCCVNVFVQTVWNRQIPRDGEWVTSSEQELGIDC